MTKKALALLLLVGCCSSEPAPAPPDPNAEAELQRLRGSLSGPETLRVKFRGEWPHAVAQMPKTVTGTLLLGLGNRAKISMTVATAYGKTKSYEAVCDGTKVWRSPTVESQRFNPAPNAFRFELLYALTWHGLGWAFPHGTHPSTIGEGYVVLDMVPEKRDPGGSRLEPAGTISHAAPNVDYRIRLTSDPSSHHPKKRELIGDKGKVWYVETYEVEPYATLSNDDFKLPQ